MFEDKFYQWLGDTSHSIPISSFLSRTYLAESLLYPLCLLYKSRLTRSHIMTSYSLGVSILDMTFYKVFLQLSGIVICSLIVCGVRKLYFALHTIQIEVLNSSGKIIRNDAQTIVAISDKQIKHSYLVYCHLLEIFFITRVIIFLVFFTSTNVYYS